MTNFPHCRHCVWTHPAHVEVHHNGCGCEESPYGGALVVDEPLFEVTR